MKFCTNSRGPQGIHSADFSDPPAFHRKPPRGWHLYWSEGVCEIASKKADNMFGYRSNLQRVLFPASRRSSSQPVIYTTLVVGNSPFELLQGPHDIRGWDGCYFKFTAACFSFKRHKGTMMPMQLGALFSLQASIKNISQILDPSLLMVRFKVYIFPNHPPISINSLNSTRCLCFPASLLLLHWQRQVLSLSNTGSNPSGTLMTVYFPLLCRSYRFTLLTYEVPAFFPLFC